jgi:hypothetical protein
MAFDVIVRTFFSDNGLSAGLARANAGLNQLARSGPGARAGLRAVEIGARQLSFAAAGLSGGMGQLARGLLLFGGGSAGMLAAVAGIGGLALAYQHLTKDSREAAAAQLKVREELARVADEARRARLPESERIGGLIGGGRTRFQELTAQIAARQAEIAAGAPTQAFSFETVAQATTRLLAADKELNDLYRERRKLGGDIGDAGERAADAAKREADERKRAAEAARALLLDQIQLAQLEARVHTDFLRRVLRPAGFTAPAFGTLAPESADPLRTGRGATFGAGLAPDLFRRPDSVFGTRAPIPRFVPDVTKSTDWLKTGQIIAQGFFHAAVAFQSGGPGGVLGGLGGLASAASGIGGISKGLASTLSGVGFAATAVGGIISLLGGGGPQRQIIDVRVEEFGPRADDQLKRTRGEPDRSLIQIVLPDGTVLASAIAEDVLYRTRRLEAMDATPRLPRRG